MKFILSELKYTRFFYIKNVSQILRFNLVICACVRQNLVFGAIFESVSDDKYFLAVIFKKDHHPFYRVMVLFCLVHLISS